MPCYAIQHPRRSNGILRLSHVRVRVFRLRCG